MSNTGNSDNSDHSGNAPRWTAKRIIALAAVILLLGLYIVTFFAALTTDADSGRLFRFCLGMTIAIPIFAWIAIWAVGVMSHRHTIASMDILDSSETARKEMEEGLARELEKESKPED